MVAKGNSLEFLTGSVLVGGASLIIVAGIVTLFISACGVVGAILLSKFVLGFVSCFITLNIRRGCNFLDTPTLRNLISTDCTPIIPVL